MMGFKPHLAGKLDFDKLDFDNTDYLASVKFDGIRAVNIGGEILTRTMKAVPNKHTRDLFSIPEFEFMDGELIVGEPNDEKVYSTTYSGVMKRAGTPDAKLYVFDYFKNPEDRYTQRWSDLFRLVSSLPDELQKLVWIVKHNAVSSIEDIEEMEQVALDTGYEGLMVRNPSRPYKFGRSSNNITDQGLLKLKRMESSEAVILEVIPEYENTNAAEKDAFGNTKRSSHKENKVAKAKVGAVRVKDIYTGAEFNIGVFRGVTSDQLEEWWEKRDQLLTCIATYDFFPIGVKNLPRHPVMKGLRSVLDMELPA